MGKEDRRMNNRRVAIITALVAALVGFGVVALLMRERNERASQQQSAPASTAEGAASEQRGAAGTPRQSETPNAQPAPGQDGDGKTTFFEEMLGAEDTRSGTTRSGVPRNLGATVVNVTIRLTLAALLAAMLAFRPRRFALLFKRNLFVAQTQILLAVVASALMMIVGDSAARAFGIFAAVSLVRFRTNIRDPKEITVLLVSLGIGLATGVGRWELAMILAFFVLLLLWALEYRESELTYRLMELSVKTRDVDATQAMLLGIFRKYNFNSEIRQLDRPDGEEEMGCVVYNVEMSPLVSTDRISNEILSADPQHVDSVEWDQQKDPSRFLQ
jgi:uncharacterized membrane protein YhiD involved in acid resistance